MEIHISVNPSMSRVGNAIAQVQVDSILRNEITKVAYRVQRFAKQLSPVKTGLMRSTIGVANMIRGLGAIVSTNVGYAIFVHEGTRFMRARPFMERGAEMTEGYIQGDIKARLDKEFTDAFKRI